MGLAFWIPALMLLWLVFGRLVTWSNHKVGIGIFVLAVILSWPKG